VRKNNSETEDKKPQYTTFGVMPKIHYTRFPVTSPSLSSCYGPATGKLV